MSEAALLRTISRETPAPLACRFRPKEYVNRWGPVPYMGEVELENRSTDPLEISYQMTALQYLHIVIWKPSGEVVSEGHFGDRFAPTSEPAILRLMPGEKFTANVPLLATLPRDKRSPGRYIVQAIYEYDGFRAVSDLVEVDFLEPNTP
jgi:hypothetical protein